MKISDSIKNISLQVKALEKNAKEAASATAAINTRLKFDDTNVSLVLERFKRLQEELEANNNRLQGIKAAQQELNEARQKEKGDTEQSKANLAEIEKLAAQYERDTQRILANIQRLNSELSQTNKNQQIISTITRQVNEKYKIWLNASENISQTTKSIYNSLKKIVTESGKVGVELFSLAKRYNTSAEDIQEWNRALQLATGQADLFTNSISVMVKGMAQIAAGRGVAFQNALKGIGVSYKEIAELDATKQFEAIVEGLASVENQSMRNAYAQQLLGESGQYVASVLAEGEQALNSYRERAAAFGIVSNSNAEALAQMNILMEQANSQMTQAKAELAVALIPAVEVFTDMIRALAPAIKSASEGFKAMGKSGQGAVIILGLLAIAAPKVIRGVMLMSVSLRAASNEATKAAIAMNLLNTSLGVFGVIGIVAGLGLLAGSLIKVKEESKKAEDALNEFGETAKGMGIYGNEAQVNAESTATSMSTKTVDIGVEIIGKGDTSISDEAAVRVAQLTADEVNKAWGEFVK